LNFCNSEYLNKKMQTDTYLLRLTAVLDLFADTFFSWDSFSFSCCLTPLENDQFSYVSLVMINYVWWLFCWQGI